MSNPYAPPSTQEDLPPSTSNKDTILRHLGALALTYILIGSLKSFHDIPSAVLGIAMLGLLINGFLRGKRRFHFWIAFFMALTISVQSYFISRAIGHPERLPVPMGPNPWLEFALAIIPHTIALLCATALYLRARRTPAAA